MRCSAHSRRRFPNACARPARAVRRATASAASTVPVDSRCSGKPSWAPGAAGYRREGIDGVANGAANISNAPIEMVENQAPIRVEHYELVPDSGGPGEWRGGMSVVAPVALSRRTRDAAATLRSPAPPSLRPRGRAVRAHHRTTCSMTPGRGDSFRPSSRAGSSKGQAMRHTTAGARRLRRCAASGSCARPERRSQRQGDRRGRAAGLWRRRAARAVARRCARDRGLA